MTKVLYVEDNEDNIYMLQEPPEPEGLHRPHRHGWRAGRRNGGYPNSPN